MTLTVGSLFSGIGGLDLGLERAGMKVIWQSEIDPYASQILKKHWPDVPNYGDIKQIDWTQIERPDVICGGYPCQPFSLAGKRAGTDDPRHLWPWVREAISALRPSYAILENVRGHLSMGGTEVIGALTALGYDAEWNIISAASIGANHKRDRIFIVAYPNGSNTPDGRQRENVPSENSSGRNDRNGSRSNFGEISVGSTRENTGNVADPAGQFGDGFNDYTGNSQQPKTFSEFGNSSRPKNVADPDSNGLQEKRGTFRNAAAFTGTWGNGARPFSNWWQVEPDVGRVANGVPRRVDRLKCLGNAVVPQVAEYVGRCIMEGLQNEQK